MNLARMMTPIVCIGWALLPGVARAEADSAGKEPATARPEMQRDTVCGPRCVQMILGQYGKEVELIELVRESQWPAIEHGATLAALEQALTKRGVYTRAMKIHPGAELTWKHPVLLHMNGQGSSGHYVVWVPASKTRGPVVWDWAGGTREWDRQTAALCSGNILLTAPSPIDDPGTAVRLGGSCVSLFETLGVVLVAVAIILLVGAGLRIRYRGQSSSTSIQANGT
jgi:hypothetical protein